jgi:hypothetical protein
MTLTSCAGVRDIPADPFAERRGPVSGVERQIMGGHFRFESGSDALLGLVDAAYARVPAHRLPVAEMEFRIELRLVSRPAAPHNAEPPAVRLQSGAGLICGVMDAANYVVLDPAQRRALVVAAEDMLLWPYHLRYELIEFAVFTLATRGLGLVPLHGACVGRDGRGILLLGASGAGKSTLALHSLLQGLDFLAEDAVFVQPERMLATGVANFLHVQADALRFDDDERSRLWLASAPVIRRRIGVEKFEADLRLGHGRLAPKPLALAGAVFVSSQLADDPAMLLAPIPADAIAARLRADQPYASTQPGWSRFERQLIARGVHELRRGAHPRAAVEALRQLLPVVGAPA